MTWFSGRVRAAISDLESPMKPLLLNLLVTSAMAATADPHNRFFPLVHDGGGWTTQITLINLAAQPAAMLLTFNTPAGFLDTWKVGLKSSPGNVSGNYVDLPLAPGATAVVETSGAPATLTRGFVEVTEYNDLPIGGYATLTRREGDRIVQRFQIPLSPEHERRSVLPVDLSDPLVAVEAIWVSITSSATLDLVFRDLAGNRILNDQLTFDNKAQIFVNLRQQWPNLKDFRGTLQWTVTFPNADRYEARILAGVSLMSRDTWWGVLPGMTLPADQAGSNPY
ncbi:MAG: hypothetical protein K2X03_05750 [Bryobacteraceae bacterium]|nr:hypothetical protein [Bryobacteraceae bacterium]